MKYKVGDKVRIVGEWPKDGSACQNREGLMDKWLGKVMTIREVRSTYCLMVEDQKDRGLRFGWAWNASSIAGLAHDPKKIVITTDGKTTTAKLFNGKDLVKSAEAKCSSCDAFDFEKGAALAVDRLLGRTVVAAEAPKFTKGDLKTGMFGRMNDGRWFVVLENKILYGQQDGDIHAGGYDYLRSFNEDLAFSFGGGRIDFVVNAVSFRNAQTVAKEGNFVWKRPGVKI